MNKSVDGWFKTLRFNSETVTCDMRIEIIDVHVFSLSHSITLHYIKFQEVRLCGLWSYQGARAECGQWPGGDG